MKLTEWFSTQDIQRLKDSMLAEELRLIDALIDEQYRRSQRMRSDELRNNILTQADSLAARGFNWGGDNELPIRPDALRLVHRALDPSVGISLAGGIDEPEAVLNKDGTIGLIFRRLHRTLTLAFECDSVISFKRETDDFWVSGVVRCLGDNTIGARDHKMIGDEARAELDALLDWLAGFDRKALL